MAAEKSASSSPDELRARIAELESRVAQLRQAHSTASGDLQPASSILESITDPFVAVDSEFRCVWVNAQAEQLHGVSRDDLLGKLIWPILPRLAESDVRHNLETALASRKPSEFEHYDTRCDLWYLSKVYPTNEGGITLYSHDITSRKLAESDLRRQAIVFDQLRDAIFSTDLGGRITNWSGGARRLFGYEAGEVLGRNFKHLFLAEFLPENQAEADFQVLQPVLQNGGTEMELRSPGKSGDECLIRLSLSLLRDETSQPYGVLAVAVDITAHLPAEQALRDSEEALRSSEERFRLAFQAIDGIVYDWHPQTGKVHRSGNLVRLLGFPLQEAEESEYWWQSQVHPDDSAASSLSVLSRLSKDQTSYETEFRMWHAAGEWVHISDRGFIIRDENGLPVRVVGSSQDITKRKRLEKALRETNQQLKFQADILATTDDAVIALGSDNLIRYCNAGAERMYGVHCSEVIGKPLSSIYVPSFLNPADEKRAQSDLVDLGHWKGETSHRRGDGSEIIVSSTVDLLSPELGGGKVMVIRDISARKTAEIKAQQHATRLALANEDLLHFAYAVSHDLQTPLRTVKSFSQLLALKFGTKLGEQGGEFIRWIVDASGRMEVMLLDLLEFAKVAGGEAEFKEEVSLEDAVSTALESLRGAIQETQAVITHDPLPKLRGDAGQFAQLFENLIGNSLKYRKSDTTPQIHISSIRHDGEWVITVADNGIGFKPEYAERIFEVFQRLHQAEFAGTGIGLSICKRIVERRGGRIWATAELGQGARFSFSVPLDVASLSIQPEARPMPVPALPASDEVLARPHFDELFHALALAQAVVRDLDGTITIWTKGSQNLFGWSEREAVGRRLHDLIKTEFRTPLAEIEATLLRDGEWTGELKAYRREGSPVWLAVHKILYRDGSGRPQSVVEVLNDISAVKEAQAALVRSSEQWDLALNAGKMGIWRWDKRTGVVEWSETLELLLGMAPGSFEGTYEAFEKLSHPDDRQPTQERIAAAILTGGDYSVENRLLRNDGTYCWVRGQGKVVADENRQPVGLIGVVWDITARKQNEDDREFLFDLSAKLWQPFVREDLADFATAQVARYLSVTRCVYSEINAEAKPIEHVAEYCASGPRLKGGAPFEEFEHIIAAAANRPFVAVNDTETDPRTVMFKTAYLSRGTGAFLSVPLQRGGAQIGLVTIAHEQARNWQDREIALLSGVAERLGPVLENARLLRETRERQEQFENTFEQAAVGMAHVALDGRWLRVNDLICRITGYSRDELLASRFQEITHPDDLAADLEQYDALQRGEVQSYSIHKRYLHKSGSIVWINLTVALARDPAGAPSYAISVIEDITARKKTAKDLEESTELAAQRLREIEAIYSQAPIGLLFLDTDLRYVRINEYLARLNGFPVGDHIGRSISEVLPEVASFLEPRLQHVLETRQPIVETEWLGKAPGSPEAEPIWLVSYLPVETPDGTLLGLNRVVQNITDRKKSETAWLEAAEKLRVATSAAQLGVFVWDAQQDFSSWENQRLYEIFGRRAEDGPINNRQFLESVIHSDDAAAHRAALDKSINSGEPFHSEVRIHRGDGATRWIEFSGKFDITADGQPMRLIGVAADITDRVEAELALRDQKQHLRSVLDSLFIFVCVLSPAGVLLEVNNPPIVEAAFKPHELTGRLLPDIDWWSYSDEVQTLIRESVQKARTGEASRFDIQALVGGNRLITLDWMITSLRDAAGEIRYLIASAVPIQERKKMEAALRQSEERYRLAEWATNDGLWDWNLITGECYFSPRFKALLGFEDHELENKAVAAFDRAHPDDAPTLHRAIQQHFEEGKPYDIEIRLLHKTAGYRWLRSRGEAVRNSDGKVVRMVGSMADIHDRKQTEALERQHDQQLRRMIDSIEQLAWMAHADGYIYWYNRRWYEYTGTTAEQMEGWGWQTVHDPSRLQEVTERWLESVRTGEPLRMEFPLRGADGVYRPFLTRVVPVRDSLGQVVRWFGTNTNIEVLLREQDLLKESERKFRELAEALPEMLWVADTRGKITYSNPQLYGYTGYALGEGFDDSWLALIHPGDTGHLFQLWQDSVATGKQHKHELRIRRHDGVYRWFLNRAEPIRDDAGNVVKWIGTSTDIHEQKLTEEALRRSNEDLEQFAYAASHDLQEPLRTVSIYSQLLARRYGKADGEAQRFATYIVNGTTRMDSLLKGILAYSRVGESVDEPALCDSEAVFKGALHNLQEAISESGAHITHDFLPAVVCAETHLLQLLQNLLGNAIKYHAERPPEIYVSAARDGSWHKFSVTDNGIGIRGEYAKQIFGMFRRLHRDEFPGVGVGLAICKRIVERYGGKIWFDSEPGQGTTFYFTLPATEESISGGGQ